MTNTDRRTALRHRYVSLGLGELASVAAFAFVALGVILPRLSNDAEAVTATAGFLPLIIILGQAGAYWLLARRWVELSSMPRRLARLFRVFGAFDVIILVAAGSYIGLHLRSTGWIGPLALGLWLLAVVEFVNYYVVRLSYPWRTWLSRVRRWRTPRLAQDLRGDPPPRQR